MEMWDCYTWDRQKLDHQHPRGVPLVQGEYHRGNLDGEPAGRDSADPTASG